MIKVGPCWRAYPAANPASNWDDKGKSDVVQVFITHGKWINSLQFLYADDNGKTVLSGIHGSPTGQKFLVVKFNYRSEYLTWISGDSSSSAGIRYLSTITFGTNKGSYGPYGSPGDRVYEFEYQFGPDRLFGGFHGSVSSDRVQSIGIYIKPIATLDNQNKSIGIYIKPIATLDNKNKSIGIYIKPIATLDNQNKK